MRTYRVSVVLGVIAVFGLLTGCGKKEAQGGSGELMILCGSSFVEPMKKLCSEFTAETGIKTTFSEGGS